MNTRLILAIPVVCLLSACDIEAPSMVGLQSGAPAPNTIARLPARYLEKQTSIKLAKIQARRFAVEPAMILGVITQESGFNVHAVSWAGAQGLMQLMPATVTHIRRNSPVQISSPFNPVDNMAAGTWYLRFLYDQFRAYPESQRWSFALASYNGGLGRVNHAIQKAAWHQKKTRQAVTWNDIRAHLPPETRHYVPAVLQHARYYRNKLKGAGFLRI